MLNGGRACGKEETEYRECVDKMTDEELEVEKVTVEFRGKQLWESSRKLDEEAAILNCKLYVIEEMKKDRLQKKGSSIPEAVRLIVDATMLVERGFGLNREAVRQWLKSLPGVKKVERFPEVGFDETDSDMFDDEENEE
jgi:hypothetical protein